MAVESFIASACPGANDYAAAFHAHDSEMLDSESSC
jgi:hypothetical protein